MTIGRLTLALVVAAVAVLRSAAKSPGTFPVGWRPRAFGRRHRPVCGSGAVVCSWSLLIRGAQRARHQAETPLIALCRFPGPALTDGAEDVGPFVALVARRARPRSTPSPDAGQRALLADARLVLEPDFNGLIFGMVGEPRDDRRGEVFLNASWASSSVCGWRGRTESRQ